MMDPQNDDEECFKWGVIAAENFNEISKNLQRISNLRKFADNYDWSGLKFPVAIKDINVLEMNNVLLVAGIRTFTFVGRVLGEAAKLICC